MTGSARDGASNTAQIGAQHYAGVFLLSMATLLLELSLTRVLSVALWYHFGFLIVSTAMLGFGASGVLLTLWKRIRCAAHLDRLLVVLGMLFALTTVAAFWLMQKIPFDPFSVLSDKRQMVTMPLYLLTAAVPFFCSGLALALLFTRGAARSNHLYAFDLVGAGLGSAGIALVMPYVGGSGSVVVAAAVGFLSAGAFALPKFSKLAGICMVLGCGTFLLAFQAEHFLPIAVTSVKRTPPVAPVYTAWNTFSRIDVFDRAADPQAGSPAMRRLVFDRGTAATGLMMLAPGVREYLARNKNDTDYQSGIAYVGKPHPKILIIGSGAGAQVLDALHFGAHDITAVEINPIINDVVSHRMNEYWGGLFRQPEVHLVTEEGRSFVRRSKDIYDAIISVHTISNAAIASGALSLAENFVLTREAIDDYLDHLSRDGVIYFTRPEPQIPRLFATAREAMNQRGVSSIADHLYAYRIPPGASETRFFGANRPAFEAGFLLKKSAFTQEEISQIRNLLQVGIPAKDPDEPNAEVLYSPADPHPGSIYQELATGTNLLELYRTSPTQIEPTTDDRPFFNHTTRWSNINSTTLHDLFASQKLGNFLLGDRPIAETTLLALLGQTVLIATLLILLPLVCSSRAGLQVRLCFPWLAYFACLGFGFISIEIALLSQFTLFLGEPVYTFAVVLASVLIFSGIGASISDRYARQPLQRLPIILATILVVLLLTAFLLPVLFRVALGLPLPLRIAFGVAALAPIGILLGMPFPIGLRMLSDGRSPLVPWCWGVNGFFTVIGTIAAQVLAMTFGFRFVLLGGAMCYGVAWIVIRKTMASESLELPSPTGGSTYASTSVRP